MLKYAVIFLIISLVAGALGMSGISQLARRVSLSSRCFSRYSWRSVGLPIWSWERSITRRS